MTDVISYNILVITFLMIFLSEIVLTVGEESSVKEFSISGVGSALSRKLELTKGSKKFGKTDGIQIKMWQREIEPKVCLIRRVGRLELELRNRISI